MARTHADDLALIRRVAAKDRQAFDTLYQQYYPRLFGYLVKLLKCPELAEEVLNDVMLVVWTAASRFRSQSRLSTWIFGIAYHQVLTALTRTPGHPPDLPPGMHVAPAHEDPADTVIRQETCDALVRAVQALPPEQRAVVELAFYHGFAYREIAEIVGCPVNTVKTRMLSARRHLAQLLPTLGNARTWSDQRRRSDATTQT